MCAVVAIGGCAIAPDARAAECCESEGARAGARAEVVSALNQSRRGAGASDGEPSLRISRPQLLMQLPVFQSRLPKNYAALWWRNLRRPPFCNMVLCNGGCAWNGDAMYSACGLVPMFPILQADGSLEQPKCGSMGVPE
jgi:hypothetical protein